MNKVSKKWIWIGLLCVAYDSFITRPFWRVIDALTDVLFFILNPRRVYEPEFWLFVLILVLGVF